MSNPSNRRIIRGYSMHPAIINFVAAEATRRNMSRSRVVEEALAKHYGLGMTYAATLANATPPQAS